MSEMIDRISAIIDTYAVADKAAIGNARSVARLVVAAMRVPTAGMVRAGCRTAGSPWYDAGYKAMIDEALK